MGSGLLLAFLLCMVSEGTGQVSEVMTGGCPNDWTKIGSRCFYMFPATMSFMDAELHCRTIKGAHLASIHSVEERFFLSGWVKYKHVDAWIGGMDAIEESNWRWTDGSKWNYTSWDKGQPNNEKNNQHCLEIDHCGGAWNDNNCETPKQFICSVDIPKKSPPPNPMERKSETN